MLFWSRGACIGSRTDDNLPADGHDTESTHSKTKFSRSWLFEGSQKRQRAASNGCSRFNKKFEASGDFWIKHSFARRLMRILHQASRVCSFWKLSGMLSKLSARYSLASRLLLVPWALSDPKTGKRRRVLGWARRKGRNSRNLRFKRIYLRRRSTKGVIHHDSESCDSNVCAYHQSRSLLRNLWWISQQHWRQHSQENWVIVLMAATSSFYRPRAHH